MLFHQLRAPLLEELTLNETKGMVERAHDSIHTFKDDKTRSQLGAEPLLCCFCQDTPAGHFRQSSVKTTFIEIAPLITIKDKPGCCMIVGGTSGD